LFDKGYASMDAGIEPTGMVLRRPLTGTPVPNLDLRWLYLLKQGFTQTNTAKTVF